MMRLFVVSAVIFCVGSTVVALNMRSRASTVAQDLSPGFRKAEAGLNESEIAGRRIWFYATAGNDRFHTYVLQQRLGVLIDWYRVLKAESRFDRFKNWGLINDPECCRPGDPDCPAKNYEETYGFDFCPGDEVLLKFVGREGYRDPACDFKDAAGKGRKGRPLLSGFRNLDGGAGIQEISQSEV